MPEISTPKGLFPPLSSLKTYSISIYIRPKQTLRSLTFGNNDITINGKSAPINTDILQIRKYAHIC